MQSLKRHSRLTLVVWGCLVMLLSTPALSAEQAIYSRGFPFSGACGVQQAEYPGDGFQNVAWASAPWEPMPISITNVSIDIRIVGHGKIDAWEVFAGNTYIPDPMTAQRYFTGTDLLDIHVESPVWPPGYGMLFPAVGPMRKVGKVHLDVHLNCSPKGASYRGFVTFWYKKLDAAAVPAQ